jgi:hypothetical protein
VGTHTGPLRSRTELRCPDAKAVRLSLRWNLPRPGGKIRSIRIYYDQIELFKQLGLMPGATAS